MTCFRIPTWTWRCPRMRCPRFVELNNEISDDVVSRIDLAKLHDRYVR